jgi:hypothetical protein
MTSSPTSSVDSPPSTSSQTADNLIDSEGAGQVVRPFLCAASRLCGMGGTGAPAAWRGSARYTTRKRNLHGTGALAAWRSNAGTLALSNDTRATP